MTKEIKKEGNKCKSLEVVLISIALLLFRTNFMTFFVVNKLTKGVGGKRKCRL